MTEPADTPELKAAIEMLRQIYWREYGRGWREATAAIKRVLEMTAPGADGECESKDG